MKIRNLFESSRLKAIVWTVLIFFAFSYLALMDILIINMYVTNVTDEMKKRTSITFLAFIIGIILRAIKSKKMLLTLIIIADLILIIFSFSDGGFIADTLWKTLKIIFIEPSATLIILSTVLLILDWKKRYKKLYYTT